MSFWHSYRKDKENEEESLLVTEIVPKLTNGQQANGLEKIVWTL